MHVALLVAAEDDIAIATTFGNVEEETIDHLHELQTPHGRQMIAAEADAWYGGGLPKMWAVNCVLVDSLSLSFSLLLTHHGMQIIELRIG